MDGPNVKDIHNDSTLTEHMSKFLSDLLIQSEEDHDNRVEWRRKLTIANNQRLGIKRVSNRPYPGAPNIPLPEADKLITKQKPNFVLSVLTPKKKAFVRIEEGTANPEQYREQVRKAELGLNHVLNNKISLIDVVPIFVDNFLEKGHAIARVIERFTKKLVHKVIDLDTVPEQVVQQLKKSPKEAKIQFVAQRFELNPADEDDKKTIDDVISQFNSGKRVIEFDLLTIESYPDIIVRPPEKVTPPAYATDIETVERLTDEFFETRRQLEDKAADGIYDKKIIDKLKDVDMRGKGRNQTEDDMIDLNKERNEGIVEHGEDELFRLKEIKTWYKPEGAERYERWVFTFLMDMGAVENSLVQKIKFPYEFDSWGYVKHDNELKDNRWHASRGEPERIRAIQEFMERGVNNMIIRDLINNNPTYTVLSNSNIQSNSIRFIPGQKIKVKSHSEIARLDDINKVDVSSERIVQMLKAYAEEYIGSTDQLFKNATNKGGGKTLGEVQLGVQIQSAPNVLKVMRFLKTMKKLYTLVFESLKERMGESMFIDGMEITKEDFNIPASVIPNGSLDLAEQALRVQKAIGRLQFTMTPGTEMIVNAEDKYNAAYDWLDADGVQDPDRYVTRPEIIQQEMRQQGQAEDKVIQEQMQGLDQEISSVQRRTQIAGEQGGQPK